MSEKDIFAFPGTVGNGHKGMTLRDYYAGQALCNSSICTGDAQIWHLKKWFGERTDVTKAEIVAAQAREYADAMLKARES